MSCGGVPIIIAEKNYKKKKHYMFYETWIIFGHKEVRLNHQIYLPTLQHFLDSKLHFQRIWTTLKQSSIDRFLGSFGDFDHSLSSIKDLTYYIFPIWIIRCHHRTNMSLFRQKPTYKIGMSNFFVIYYCVQIISNTNARGEHGQESRSAARRRAHFL